jgi:hypothetical protein
MVEYLKKTETGTFSSQIEKKKNIICRICQNSSALAKAVKLNITQYTSK